MQFNEKLKDLRIKKGISQAELAEQIFVSRSAVAKWENGLGLPSEDSLTMLAQYFSVNREELYSDKATEAVIVNKNITISKSRKLLAFVSATCLLVFIALTTALIAVTGNRRSAYRVPDNCCVVSVPIGFDLWTKNEAVFKRIQTDIAGIERKENRTYYVIEKDTEFLVSIQSKCIYDSTDGYKGKIVTALNVFDSVIPVEPDTDSDVALSCNRNLDIEPVYEDFVRCGIFISVVDENDIIWDKVNNANKYFNADGSIKTLENFYYIFSGFPESTRFETNLPVIAVDIEENTRTYIVERLEITKSQRILYCTVNRYGENYFFDNVSVTNVANIKIRTFGLINNYKIKVWFI